MFELITWGALVLLIGILLTVEMVREGIRKISRRSIRTPSLILGVGLLLIILGLVIPPYSNAQLDILKRGVGDWNEWRQSNPSVEVDLERADLSYAQLVEANLSEANLWYANLSGADLTRADLTDADLTGADLTDADLTDAKLKGAKGM